MMSLKQRREIAFWFMMIIGMAITIIQLYRYATNTLSYTTAEMVMNIIAVAFMIFPRFILNMAEKFVAKKTE
jgi:cellulose synthase/poly-beta-1,6-N-acetylglucosamine synthase-like glycosyltransferase